MRGQDGQTSSMFSYVDMEERVPAHHPLRKICEFVNAALAALDAEFARLYSADGRPSIAPERLLRAALIQILFSIRSACGRPCRTERGAGHDRAARGPAGPHHPGR